MKTKIWYGKDVDIRLLKKSRLAIIGYGNQGRVQANNLKKSGISPIIGLRRESKGWEMAIADGHEVKPVEDAIKFADIIHVLLPDSTHAQFYEKMVRPNLKPGKTLSFSHGASIYWKWITPPKDVDVILAVPQTLAQNLEKKYDSENIMVAISVHQDYSSKALEKVLELSKGIGGSGTIMISVSFKEEAVVNWFAEQTVLCGGISALIMKSYKVIVDAGFSPELAYFQVLHQLKESTDLIQKNGILGMYSKVSDTARYGGLTNGPFIINSEVEKKMKKVLDDIINGTFQDKISTPHENSIRSLMKEVELSEIEKISTKMRQLMFDKNKSQI